MSDKQKIFKYVVENGGFFIGFAVGFNSTYRINYNIVEGFCGGLVVALIGHVFSSEIMLTLPISIPIVLYYRLKNRKG